MTANKEFARQLRLTQPAHEASRPGYHRYIRPAAPWYLQAPSATLIMAALSIAILAAGVASVL